MAKENPTFPTRDMLNYEQATKFQLRIFVTTNKTGVLYVTGSTKEGIFTITIRPDPTNNVNITDMGIADLPIWISAIDAGGFYEPGTLHCTIMLMINGNPVQVLATGYVGYDEGISYPAVQIERAGFSKGELVLKQITNPAAGAEISYQLVDDCIARIRGLMFQLVTDGNAGNRVVHVVFNYKGQDLIHAISANSQAASLTGKYKVQKDLSGGATLDNGFYIIPLPDDTLLDDDGFIKTVTTNIKAGDQYSNIYVLLEKFRIYPI